MKNNKIPRKFNLIVGKMLIDTNVNKAGDVLHISKDEHGYIAFNTRTNKYASLFISMMRNNQVFEVMNVE